MKPHSQKWIQLSDSYNRSTNLELDFKDPNRLKSIYVSKKFQTGLKEILSSVLEIHSKHRVRVLSGSPGLGKSTFALWVAQTISKQHPQIINNLLKKSSKALREQFNSFQNSKNTKLLPVFINGYEGDIEKVFQNKLTESLSAINISFISKPQNAQCQQYKEQSNDTLKFYQDSLKILKTKGYGGIFVIYDEFGKYLERAVHNPSNLNIQFLQNFAEFCDRSGANQCHLTLITHLSISQYARQLPVNIQREWTKIEGRFQESAFYDKNSDYYKMISGVFKKNIVQTAPVMAQKYKCYIKKYISGFQADALEGFMDSEGVEEILLDCFPLHPIVLSLLPYLSMKVAQNERTLYTFLTRNENNSLKRFLEERFQNETTLVLPFDLYQYFSPLIGKDIGIGGTYKIQLMAEEAWTQINKQDEISKQIISLMALCSVIKNSHFAPLTEEFISSCFNQTFCREGIKKSLKSLRYKKIIFYDKKKKQYLLQEGSPVDIDEKINKLKTTTLTGKSLVHVLKRYFKPDFIVPKKYNLEHAITRFYRTEMISVEELKNLTKKQVVNFYREDGQVFYVVPFSHDELTYAKSVIQKIHSSLTVFVLPKQFIECRKDIEELNAVDCLYNNKEILSASPLVKKELDRHKDILLSSLHSLLKPLIGYMGLSAHVIYSKEDCAKGKPAPWKEIIHFKELQRYLGDLFEKEYNKYVNFNLEYVNRHSVSGSVTLGQKKFIDSLISHKKAPTKNIESFMDGQGPGYAIFNTIKRLSGFKFKKEKNIYEVSTKSDYFSFFREYQKILSKQTQGIKGSALLDILVAPPYGLRLGVIPVFTALSDLCLKQPVSYYFDSAYVKDPDGAHYNLMMKYPGKTVIHYTTIDDNQQKFLDGLSRIWQAKDGSLRSVIEALIKWRKSIPESTKLSSDLSQSGRKILIQIDSSKEPDRLLFKGIPECFSYISLVDDNIGSLQIKNTLSDIKKTKKEIDHSYKNLLLKIKDDLIDFIEFTERECLNSYEKSFVKKSEITKTIFEEAEPLGSFSSGKQDREHESQAFIPEWRSNKKGIIQKFQTVLVRAKDYPLSPGACRFIGRALHFNPSHHHQYFLETMADVLTGASPRYWDNKGYSKFKFALKKIKTEIELVCEIAHPAFKGQSVLAFIDRGSNKKTFLKLGAFSGKDKRLKNTVEKIKKVLDPLDEIDKRKIILSVLKSFEKDILSGMPPEEDIEDVKGHLNERGPEVYT